MSTSAPSASPLAALHAVGAMQSPVVHCPPETPLREIASVMAERCIHCVATGGVTRDRLRGLSLVWGIVTDLDVVRAALDAGPEPVAGTICAGEVVTVDPDETLDVVARRMSEHDLTHVVVVADGEPVGVISTLDIASALARETSR